MFLAISHFLYILHIINVHVLFGRFCPFVHYLPFRVSHLKEVASIISDLVISIISSAWHFQPTIDCRQTGYLSPVALVNLLFEY